MLTELRGQYQGNNMQSNPIVRIRLSLRLRFEGTSAEDFKNCFDIFSRFLWQIAFFK